MRLLVDANLSPRVAAQLSSAGFEAVHVADVGLLTASDNVILKRTNKADAVMLTAVRTKKLRHSRMMRRY